MSVKHRVYSRIYSACVNESLNELSYPAKQAGLNYSIKEGYEGIYVDVNGYTESAIKLYELILEHMVAFSITDTQFEAIKDKIVRDYENFSLSDAHQRPLALPWNDPAPATQLLAISSAHAGERLHRTLQTRLPKLTVIRTTSPLDHHSTWLEIFPGNVSKSKTARWLCGELNLDTRQIATIGNDYNDIDLLEWGAYSYVVGNAPEDLRDQFTPVSRHDDNGFTEAINRWLVHSSGSLPR